ncbi:MAG: acyltransferase [Ignavibacteria bacterium]|nr:acyltransferase [Ignavibacteria bacterium]
MISDHNISYDNTSGKSVSYMPQLDSLRTFAVFSVLIGHWFAEFEKFSNFPFGMFGVTLFFVLSGFLITQILISGRIDTEEIFKKKIHSIKQFYIRRTLRIFPIYYITIFICLLFNVQDIRDKFFWFLFYASNIYFYNINDWAGSLSHLWTLAVEEQFYLLWPFIILLFRRSIC